MDGADIIWGCMYSGKSTECKLRLTRFADFGVKCLYVNHSSDVRLSESGDDVGTSHNSTFEKLSKKVDRIKVSSLDDADFDKYKVIGIDEFQFFSGTVPLINKLVNMGKKIIIASLDCDFKKRPFGESHLLVGLCGPGRIIKLPAICKKCDPEDPREAGWTLKIGGSDDVIDVGGIDKYLPVCSRCYDKYNIH